MYYQLRRRRPITFLISTQCLPQPSLLSAHTAQLSRICLRIIKYSNPWSFHYFACSLLSSLECSRSFISLCLFSFDHIASPHRGFGPLEYIYYFVVLQRVLSKLPVRVLDLLEPAHRAVLEQDCHEWMFKPPLNSA